MRPERIWLEDGNDEYPRFYYDNSEDCTEYVRADIHAAALAAERAKVRELVEALKESYEFHEYCGWGDSYERECARESGLTKRIEALIEKCKEEPNA